MLEYLHIFSLGIVFGYSVALDQTEYAYYSRNMHFFCLVSIFAKP